MRKSDLFDNIRSSSYSWLSYRGRMTSNWLEWLKNPLLPASSWRVQVGELVGELSGELVGELAGELPWKQPLPGASRAAEATFDDNSRPKTKSSSPYDPNEYAQNFDQGLMLDNYDDLSRSFSARFAVPSTVFHHVNEHGEMSMFD
ncbi:hypothetical protein Tco_1025117 [Tanacetum coccineum]